MCCVLLLRTYKIKASNWFKGNENQINFLFYTFSLYNLKCCSFYETPHLKINLSSMFDDKICWVCVSTNISTILLIAWITTRHKITFIMEKPWGSIFWVNFFSKLDTHLHICKYCTWIQSTRLLLFDAWKVSTLQNFIPVRYTHTYVHTSSKFIVDVSFSFRTWKVHSTRLLEWRKKPVQLCVRIKHTFVLCNFIFGYICYIYTSVGLYYYTRYMYATFTFKSTTTPRYFWASWSVSMHKNVMTCFWLFTLQSRYELHVY